jgi:serine/threonine-protein kinase HipA
VAPNDIADEDEAETLWAAGKHAEDGELRFSLAGVQLKFSVLRQGDEMTLPAHGMGGEWIAKLDSSRFPHVVENEYAILQWARAAGFEVPECHIYPTTALSPSLRRFAALDRSLLLIRRYDRRGAVRIHQEDLAQVIGRPPRQKYDAITYEQCAALVRANVGEEGYFEFIRRLAFVVATGNNDAHLKNWSFVYPNGINAELSPLYDQVCTIAWPEVRSILALPLLKNRYPARIEESTFSRLATHAGEDSARTLDVVRVTLRRIAASWRLSAGIEVMPSDHFTALLKYWRKVPLLRAYTEELVGT